MGRKDSDDSSSAEEFITAFEEGESTLQAALDADEIAETWSFDDIDVDSGTFGELVSRGVVEKHDGDYRLAEPDDVRVALSDEESTNVSDDSATIPLELSDFSIDYRALTGLLVSLAIVAGTRVITVQRAFQNGYAISPANDPYFFRYHLDRLLAESNGISDVQLLSSNVFEGIRPFTHATNWVLAELLGGGEWAAATVAMWAPVVAAVGVAVLLYKLTVLLTRDQRVGIATVLVFALTPTNAVYTSLGFVDHNYNQYLWLGVTLLTLGWLAVDLRRRLETQSKQTAVAARLTSLKTWVVAGGCGLSIAFGTHAWGGSPLLLFPLAGYIGLRVPLDVRAGLQPLRTLAPTVIAVMIGGVFSFGLHSVWGWHSRFVALTPLVVALGGVVVTAVGELWRQQSFRTDLLLPTEIVITGIESYLFVFYVLDGPGQVAQRAGDLFFRETAVETGSLFALESLVLLGPLNQFGLPFYFAIGALVLGVIRLWRVYEPGWLLVGMYTLVLLVIAGFQTRFGGQLAIPLSIFGGVGIVYGLATVGLVRYPHAFDTENTDRPERDTTDDQGTRSITLPAKRRTLYLCGLGVVVFSFNLIAIPGAIGVHSYAPAHADAVSAIDTHSEQVNREYPENYVLSGWSRNRMYNYFVNGESQSYGYARNTYEPFITASDPDAQYDQLAGRVGYIIVDSVDIEVPKESTQGQLLRYLKSNTTKANPPAHYQLLSIGADQSLAAYAVVPGAKIAGETTPGEQVVVNTSVTVDGHSLTRGWTVTAGESGRYTVTVPYAGQYRIGETTVEVPSSAVMNGTQVTAGEHAIS
jgi:dolichyl-diphosphooligosaccharide--protein glycosyltransferase